MLTKHRLSRAREAVGRASAMHLPRELWGDVATAVRRLIIALHTGDDTEAKTSTAELVRLIRAHGGSGPLHRRGGGEQVFERRSDPRWPSPSDRTRAKMTSPAIPVPAELVDDFTEAASAIVAATAEVECTPHIAVDTTTPVQPGQTFVAAVYLDRSVAAAGEAADPFVLDRWPSGLDAIPVEVWLTGSGHFDVTQPAVKRIWLDRESLTSDRAEFEVAVRHTFPSDAGEPRLMARFDYNLMASGSVRLAVPVATVAAGAVTATDVVRESYSTPEPAVVLSPQRGPDLRVSVARRPGSAGTYDVVVETALGDGGPVEDVWSLPMESAQFVATAMAGFVADGVDPLSRRQLLEGVGIDFFDAAPAAFKRLYWDLVDAGTPPRTVSIVSDERHIPWELMIPWRDGDDGREDRHKPLGVACVIGRWHYGTAEDYRHPVPSIPLHDSLVLAPQYPRDRLAHTADERDFVLDIFPGHDVPATYAELDEFYRTNTASLLHFACHGSDATLQAIELLDDQLLRAQQVHPGGLGECCRKSRPLVFLNACEVGRPGVALVAVGGFPASFIRCRAGAIIAPLWSVDDEVAHEVAKRFYAAVRRDPRRPFADIVRELRARAYDADDGRDSFAAYCFYGNPWAAARRS